MDDADGSVGVREVAVTLRKPPWPKGSLEAVGSVICQIGHSPFFQFAFHVSRLFSESSILTAESSGFHFHHQLFFLLGELALWILALLSPACIKTRLIQPRPSLPTQTARPNWKMGRTASPISSSSTKFQPRDGRGLVPSPAGSRLLHLGLSASRELQKSRAVFEEPSDPNPTRVTPFRRRHRDENRDTDNQPHHASPTSQPTDHDHCCRHPCRGCLPDSDTTAWLDLAATPQGPSHLLSRATPHHHPASLHSAPKSSPKKKEDEMASGAKRGRVGVLTIQKTPPIFSMRQGDCGTCGMPPQISRFGFFEPLCRPIPRLEKKSPRAEIFIL